MREWTSLSDALLDWFDSMDEWTNTNRAWQDITEDSDFYERRMFARDSYATFRGVPSIFDI